MLVDRETLLAALEAVSPGLSPREVIEQSNSFVFMEGKVFTFNEEVSCSMPVKLNGITGAVSAKTLLESLRRMPEDTLDLNIVEGCMALKGKGRKVSVKMDAQTLLPIGSIDKPDVWQELSPEYSIALGMVQECAKDKDEDRFIATCVNIRKGVIEASGTNTQLMKYKVTTRMKEPSLVKKTSAKHIANMGPNEFSETGSWLHYKNDSGLVMSCRRFVEDYPDMREHYKVEGSPIVLPKGMSEAADMAEVFSGENKDSNYLLLEVKPGKVRLTGEGVTGKYEEFKSIKYDGPEMAFLIPPKLLKQVIERYDKATINQNRLFVEGEKFTYVSVLRSPEALKKAKVKKEE